MSTLLSSMNIFPRFVAVNKNHEKEDMMRDLMKMIESLFEGTSGDNPPEENVKMEPAERHFRIKRACRTVLADMKREIDAMGHARIALDAKRDALIDEYNALVREVKDMDGNTIQEDIPNPDAEPPETEDLSPESQMQTTEKIDDEETGSGSETKENAGPEFKRLSKHRVTGNQRLDTLEAALHDALERLNNTKMAYHFMTIKEVRLALSGLYRNWNKPEDERIAELEAGLKEAVEKLSTNPSAANSKIMPEIWGDLIVALQESKDDNQ